MSDFDLSERTEELVVVPPPPTTVIRPSSAASVLRTCGRVGDPVFGNNPAKPREKTVTFEDETVFSNACRKQPPAGLDDVFM